MSAHAYASAMPPPPRRHPLASAANHPAVNVVPLSSKLEVPPQVPPKDLKQPGSPPLPRQNAKVTPPSPPKVIMDKTRTLQFLRVGMLGEGGFARVYEVKDRNGIRAACKVVTKGSLKTKKAKTKLYAEIKIHRSLDHPNIVRFQDCFEDEENVYMTLELCHNGSLMDMLRRRRRFTEPEARYFMVQLIGACHYMHTHQVIHRDLKLGNIFLDSQMNVKVGDFGLAALIESPGERKKTICGTPNYIAPEVLFDTANGHSFEVDTWSIGVILYTLVVGRPPFQTKDVKAIYKRIRDNEYDFPADRVVSTEVQELVQAILTPNPQERPTLHQIVDHEFFTNGIVPGYIPNSAHDAPPDFRHITPPVSQANLARLRKTALLDEEVTSIAVPSAPAPATTTTESTREKVKGVTSTLAQQEKEFQKAVQPGSPISALLSSARQPLLVAPGSGNTRGEQPLIRKLQAAREAKSPARPTRLAQNLQNIEEEQDAYDTKQEDQRRKELESQKARIVAQMVPTSAPNSAHPLDEQENMPPAMGRDRPTTQLHRERFGDIKASSSSLKGKAKETLPSPPVAPPVTVLEAEEEPQHAGAPPLRKNGFDAVAQTLTAAFDARAMGRLFRDPRADAHLPDPKVFIVSWLDYCNKYGMGYAFSDGSVGVHFNDSSTVVLAADKHHFDYVTSRRNGQVYVRKNYNVAEYPEDVKAKVYLLKYFERYIMDKLYHETDYTYEDHARTKGMVFVQRYLRMKHVILFKLSHDVLQFNFYDHSKLIFSSEGLVVTHIDKDSVLTRWTLAELMALSLRPPASDPQEAKFQQKMLDKLKYCKEVLISIKNASTTVVNGQQVEEIPGLQSGPGSATGLGGISARNSKASLR
ncbi:Cell cycle serine/threonine-protein kinase cdc5/MSD2 [Steccherinum ochraceum]|uniref:Serine/threonine-protein kinase n=1 Tax=Steccherinum ochraceum TaxID=92696 RepID=A0A4R0RK97_9APHY|nr:Cell cycle serine/threonine-protein kinase cdc5/MSD2 [Steccherinum ochraceum]